jgi:hypothetical protein
MPTILLAGAHVAIIYHSSPDAPDKAKEIAEKYKVRCEVSCLTALQIALR